MQNANCKMQSAESRSGLESTHLNDRRGSGKISLENVRRKARDEHFGMGTARDRRRLSFLPVLFVPQAWDTYLNDDRLQDRVSVHGERGLQGPGTAPARES